MAELDASIVAAVSNSNFKSLAERVAVNAVSHDHRLQLLAESSMGQILNRMNSLDPTEAAAVARVHRTPSGDALSDATAVVSIARELIRSAQPPSS